VIAGYGFDHDNVAYYDDLYLDVVVYTNGNILIDDKDELMNAYKSDIISKDLYDLAEDTAVELIKGILKDVSYLKEFCMKYLSLIESEYTN
jgi:predicted RNA-binding protein associated with RNAse of E/G family